ncbi:MAG: glycosyltransferase family 2 protein [Selenomonas sp.]|uniref:glycosyltransferase family 2 protein n=1 Tax=Selenomonas sp. TaxID=2053611 RepID=UPI0025E8BC87|nr:glycosyltransferase family 2 protein [Selenomonas sp.]MCR5438564.1 glycosyltransferase family 2 protein [Selenomonas sp.]
MVYICVLNYNNAKDTILCLESLLKLRFNEYKIILVDNASIDDSRDVLSKYALDKEKVVFMPLDNNRGYAAGNNVALKHALSCEDMDYCWILNNDTTVEDDALSWLVEHMEKRPEIGLCGSKLVYSWDRSCIQGYGGTYKPWIALSGTILDEKDIPYIDYVIGASVFVSREFLKKIGLMCEDYFLYFEETDWAERARGKFKLSCEPRSVVYHKEGAVVGANAKHPEEKSELADYYSMRNRLLFTWKFYPQYIPTVYLSSLVMIWNRFRRHQYKRMWMFVKLLFGIRDSRFECKAPMDKV